MASSVKTLEAFNQRLGDLMVEIKRIKDMDMDDDMKAHKLHRKISHWFKTGGIVSKS